MNLIYMINVYIYIGQYDEKDGGTWKIFLPDNELTSLINIIMTNAEERIESEKLGLM